MHGKWTRTQWEEAIGNSKNWEIVPLSAEVKDYWHLDEDYTIQYVGPIIRCGTVEKVPDVPVLYRTFQHIPDLVHMPLGLHCADCYEVVFDCINFSPSKEELFDFMQTRSGCRAAEPFKYSGSKSLFQASELGACPSEMISNLFSIDKAVAHARIVERCGINADEFSDFLYHDARSYITSSMFLRLVDLFPDKIQWGTTIKFTTGYYLNLIEVAKASEMNHAAQSVVGRLALSAIYYPARINEMNTELYHLKEGFVIDNDDVALINAFGIKLINMHLSNAYKAGTDATVEVYGESSIVSDGCPLQASGTLMIKGSGSLVIECVEGMQACIGTETHTGMSYGRWKPGRSKLLDKIVIDGVHVICKSKVDKFSLGSYGEAEQPEIECINGGSIECPEVNGYRIMVESGAEGLSGSTKRSFPAVYDLQPFSTKGSSSPKKLKF